MLQKYFSLKGFIREPEQPKVYTSKPHRGKIFINALICRLFPNYVKKKERKRNKSIICDMESKYIHIHIQNTFGEKGRHLGRLGA